MPIDSVSISSANAGRPQSEATGAASPYSSQDLPKVDSVNHLPQSLLRQGEELIERVIERESHVMFSVATQPTGLEGIQGFSHTSLSAGPMSMTSPNTDLTSEQLDCFIGSMHRRVEESLVNQISGASPEFASDVRQMESAVVALEKGDYSLARRLAEGNGAHVVINHLADHFEANPQSLFQRIETLVNFFCTTLQNKFEGDGPRWFANVANVLLRDLLAVGLTTVVRQLLGMALECRYILDDLKANERQWIGGAVMLLTMLVNVLDATHDELNGSATNTSRLAHGGMFGLSLSVLAAAFLTNSPAPFSQMASFGMQVAGYVILRDGLQMVFPLKDNTTSLSGSSTAMAGLGYGCIQVVSSLLMDKLAPNSGAGYPMGVAANIENAANSLTQMLLAQSVASTAPTASTADIREKIVAAIQALAPQLGDDFTRAFINTLAEVGDDLLRPAIARHREVQALIATTRKEAMDEGRDPDEAVNNIPAEQLQGLRIYFGTPRLPYVGTGFPTLGQFLGQAKTFSMRLSIFQSLIAAILVFDTVADKLGLSAVQKIWGSYGVLFAVLQAGYTPFLMAHATQPAPTMSRGGSDDGIAMQSMGTSLPPNAESDDEVLQARQ